MRPAAGAVIVPCPAGRALPAYRAPSRLGCLARQEETLLDPQPDPTAARGQNHKAAATPQEYPVQLKETHRRCCCTRIAKSGENHRLTPVSNRDVKKALEYLLAQVLEIGQCGKPNLTILSPGTRAACPGRHGIRALRRGL